MCESAHVHVCLCVLCRRGYVMSVATRAEDEAAKSLGLSPQHQYGLLQAKTLGTDTHRDSVKGRGRFGLTVSPSVCVCDVIGVCR